MGRSSRTATTFRLVAHGARGTAERSRRAAREDIVGRLRSEAIEADLDRSGLRRKVVERIALRDRPVLEAPTKRIMNRIPARGSTPLTNRQSPQDADRA